MEDIMLRETAKAKPGVINMSQSKKERRGGGKAL